MTCKRVSLREAVGGGYDDFWRFRGRYRVVKGGRGSKKSRTAALNFIVRLMRCPEANLLVVRRTYRTLRDSCLAELRWAAERLGVRQLWSCRESAPEMTYLPTGQKIFFRGLDDPMKLSSIAVTSGVLCWLWIEEAYELSDERDFDLLDECIRGAGGPFKQITLTFNPWNERHWLKKRFFDSPGPEVLAKTVDYRCNEFLDESDRRLFEEMKKRDPLRYRVAGLGEWGVSEGLVFENWELREFRREELSGLKPVFGLDFGYVSDPAALFCGLADPGERVLFVFDELYLRGMSNRELFEEIRRRGYRKERIRADSAEPKSIDELRELGLSRLVPARKGRDSVSHGIRTLRDYHIVIHPRCGNFLREISCYRWETDRDGRSLGRPEDRDNHLMDAMRYAVEDLAAGERFSFS